jgi:nuclear cap-binding protein subunit 2
MNSAEDVDGNSNIGDGSMIIPAPGQFKLPPPPRASQMVAISRGDITSKKLYWDRTNYATVEDQLGAVQSSSTLYIGNLAFSTRSRHLHHHFMQYGGVSPGGIVAIHMGLDRNKKTPCGFAFVEYRRRQDALIAVSQLSGTKLDGRVIRVELDAGFKPGRQFGRGMSGGQVREDRRNASMAATLDRRSGLGNIVAAAARKRSLQKEGSAEESNPDAPQVPNETNKTGMDEGDEDQPRTKRRKMEE